MKSYFAKLAARATLTNVPVSSAGARSKMSDPFEATSLPEHDGPPPAAAGPVFPTDDSNRRSSPQIPAKTIDELRPPAERADSNQPAARETTFVKPPVPALESQSQPRSQEPAPQRESATQVMPKTEPAPVPAPGRSEESEESGPNAAENIDEGLAEVQRAQAVLLRKADAFMERILKRREPVTTRHQLETEEEKSGTDSNRQPEIVWPARLQRPPPTPQISEPLDERPSLVIGRLTVEVMPPSPVPVSPPAPQVVVVRGPREARNAIASSRRFGLGQF
jgi:hypothetical protein